jgi:AcrR family transcriptional regulator
MPKATDQSGVAAAARPETRERLLVAAVSGIARDGWGGVTTRSVAELAGVNPGLVHYHFGSMAELRREAVVWALSRELSAPTAALVEARSVATGVRRCLDALAAIDPASETSAVLYESMLAATRDEALREELRRALEGFRLALANRIEAEHGADPTASAATVAAALDGILLHRLVEPGLDAGRLAEPLIEALLLPGSATSATAGRSG